MTDHGFELSPNRNSEKNGGWCIYLIKAKYKKICLVHKFHTIFEDMRSITYDIMCMQIMNQL